MKSFEGYLKKKLGNSYVLLAGGGHNDLNELLNSQNYYGLENLAVSVTSGARCTTTDNGQSITTIGNDGDTYFYINSLEPFQANQIYTLGFYIENWPSGVTGSWSFGFGNQSNSYWQITFNSNGWFWATGKYSEFNGINTSILVDDSSYSGNIRTYQIKISKFVLVKGNIKAYWSPAISNMRVAYASHAGISDDVYAWAKASTKPTYTYSEVGAAASNHDHDSVYSKLGHTHNYVPSVEVNAVQTDLTWIKDYVTNNPRTLVYNTSGTEWTYLTCLRNNSGNGAVLKIGYSDTYLRILRVVNSTWQSTDWEKISAGYADNSGQLEGHSASYFSIAGHTHTFGDVSGCPLWITGSSDRKLYLKDTDGEKYSLISFQDKDGAEYGLLGVHGDSVLQWNNNVIWHSGNDGHTTGLDADLLDGQHGSYYATATHDHNGIYLDYGRDVRDIGSDAPIANAKTYVSTTNLPNAFKILYDSAGYENTLLYTFRPGSITANSSGTGTILKWGAWSTYMYIANF